MTSHRAVAFLLGYAFITGCNDDASSVTGGDETSTGSSTTADDTTTTTNSTTDSVDETTGGPPETCVDGVRNQDESDVDCGGQACSPCDVGQACNEAGDCVSLVCSGNTCQAPACTDGAKNGDETDVDCGGSCAPCAPNQGCSVPEDCTSGICENEVCVPASCRDGVLNGTETVATRTVRLGPAIGGRQVVLEGLETDERIVVNGHVELSDGAKVRFRESN